MHNLKLWSPTNLENNLQEFLNSLDKNLNIKNYKDLHEWSIEKKDNFWNAIWNYTKIVGDKKGKIFKPNIDFINENFPDHPNLSTIKCFKTDPD